MPPSPSKDSRKACCDARLRGWLTANSPVNSTRDGTLLSARGSQRARARERGAADQPSAA